MSVERSRNSLSAAEAVPAYKPDDKADNSAAGAAHKFVGKPVAAASVHKPAGRAAVHKFVAAVLYHS